MRTHKNEDQQVLSFQKRIWTGEKSIKILLLRWQSLSNCSSLSFSLSYNVWYAFRVFHSSNRVHAFATLSSIAKHAWQKADQSNRAWPPKASAPGGWFLRQALTPCKIDLSWLAEHVWNKELLFFFLWRRQSPSTNGISKMPISSYATTRPSTLLKISIFPLFLRMVSMPGMPSVILLKICSRVACESVYLERHFSVGLFLEANVK